VTARVGEREPRGPAGARRQAGIAAVLLLLAGVALGVLLDRAVLLPRQLVARPLTAEALAADLGLAAAEEARIRVLLDSMHADVMAAAAGGPEALAAAARSAHERIEAALPPHARVGFREWVQLHHRQMMERGVPHGGAGPPAHGPGGSGGDTP
jgi:hypothetical protein